MKNGVRKLFFHESLQAVLVGCNILNKTRVLLSVPRGKGLPYDKTKVQASKPYNHITALQGFDQVMSVTIPLAKARTSPKSRGCR